VHALRRGPVAGVHDVPQAQVAGSNPVHASGEGVVHYEHAGVDLGEGLGDLGDGPPDVDRDDDPAGPQRGGEDLREPVGVERQDGRAGAFGDPEVAPLARFSPPRGMAVLTR